MAQSTSFRCPACGAEFSTQEELQQHGKQHQATHQHEGHGFRCPACGAEFETQEQLEAHAKAAHQQ